MNEVLVETMRSLTGLMREESGLLTQGRRHEIAELAAAKLRLTAQLEKQVAAAERQDPDWQQRLGGKERDEFVAAVQAMQEEAAENGRRILRQIELSRELMEAIAAEAKRLGGTRSEVYGSAGAVQRSELPAPISINARL